MEHPQLGRGDEEDSGMTDLHRSMVQTFLFRHVLEESELKEAFAKMSQKYGRRAQKSCSF
jgi:hypothetical protein